VDRRKISEREAVDQARGKGTGLDFTAERARTKEARTSLCVCGRVLSVGLEVPVRRDESAYASAVAPGISKTGVQVPLAIEMRPRAEPAYQQRTGRLCCRRSAEE
jgi:hypothetical protein